MQVESYLRIIGEPKLPSAFLQVRFGLSGILMFCISPVRAYIVLGLLVFFYLIVSSKLQVICWVLGEYGTADGKYSASYISGKLCDVAEAHSSDDTVKVCLVLFLTDFGHLSAIKVILFKLCDQKCIYLHPSSL